MNELGVPSSLVVRDCDVADARGTRRGVDLVVNEGVIAAVAPAGKRRTDDRVIDGSGTTVVPGLINMHEHLGVVHPGTHEEAEFRDETHDELRARMVRNAELALRAGVTSVRLVGEPDGVDNEVRALVAAGTIRGPRIWTAARPLDYAGGGRAFVGAVECSSADEFRRAASMQVARGADFLKVMLSGSVVADGLGATGLSLEEFEAIRQVARHAGLRIAMHTDGAAHPIMDTVVADGVDSLEHCYAIGDELLERCAGRGLLLVLTPLVTRSPEYLLEIGVDEQVVAGMRDASERHWNAVCSAVELGATIALGTDVHSHAVLNGAHAPVRELELYEEAGCDPQSLLELASRAGASWLGVSEQLGLVEPSFAADLLVLEESPYERGASAFRRIRHVISNGHLVGNRS